jgi:hypothetical protein
MDTFGPSQQFPLALAAAKPSEVLAIFCPTEIRQDSQADSSTPLAHGAQQAQQFQRVEDASPRGGRPIFTTKNVP